MKPLDALCAALALPDAVRSDLDRLLGSDALDVARSDPPRVALAVDALVSLRRLDRHPFELEAVTALARLARDQVRHPERGGHMGNKGHAAWARLSSLGLTEKDLNDQ